MTGARKLFFGSTTERVLRETTRPVLVTPPADPGRFDWRMSSGSCAESSFRWISHRHRWTQTKIAAGIADALDLPAILAYVIEPIRTPLAARLHLAGIQGNRRAVADDRLKDLLAIMPQRLHPEALLAYGDPAEELAKIVNDRQVGLIVVGLHGSPLFGPRMGSVTYRLLCLTKTLVLAVPPQSSDLSHEDAEHGVTTASER